MRTVTALALLILMVGPAWAEQPGQNWRRGGIATDPRSLDLMLADPNRRTAPPAATLAPRDGYRDVRSQRPGRTGYPPPPSRDVQTQPLAPGR